MHSPGKRCGTKLKRPPKGYIGFIGFSGRDSARENGTFPGKIQNPAKMPLVCREIVAAVENT
jgi:hypothetical protein